MLVTLHRYAASFSLWRKARTQTIQFFYCILLPQHRHVAGFTGISQKNMLAGIIRLGGASEYSYSLHRDIG